MFRHFAVITPQSPRAGEASQCAADQGRFWEYHDYLYEQAEGLSVDQLKQYGVAVGLNTTQFNDCVDSREHRGYVESDRALAVNAGARGTPTFMVNDQIVVSPSFATLVAAIRAAQ